MSIEKAIVDALPHASDCGENRLCHCGVTAKRNVLLHKIVKITTREGRYVYLFRD